VMLEKILEISRTELRTDVSTLNTDRELIAKVALLKLQYFAHAVRGSAG